MSEPSSSWHFFRMWHRACSPLRPQARRELMLGTKSSPATEGTRPLGGYRAHVGKIVLSIGDWAYTSIQIFVTLRSISQPIVGAPTCPHNQLHWWLLTVVWTLIIRRSPNSRKGFGSWIVESVRTNDNCTTALSEVDATSFSRPITCLEIKKLLLSQSAEVQTPYDGVTCRPPLNPRKLLWGNNFWSNFPKRKINLNLHNLAHKKRESSYTVEQFHIVLLK